MHIPQRARHFAALILSVIVLFACGATTTVVQGGGGGAPTKGTSATATSTTPPLPTPTATPNPGRYDGTWVDDVALSRGAGELIISNSGTTAAAQAYGLCGTICTWGTSSAVVGPYSLVLSFSLSSTYTAALTMQLSNTDIKVVEADTYNGSTTSTTYFMHRASATEAKAFLYASNWVNDDPNTQGIPQIYITVTGTKISAHAYGKCSPTYCDWGTQSGTYASDPFNLTYDYNSITISVSLSLLNAAGSSLQAVMSDFAGSHTYTFHKSAVA